MYPEATELCSSWAIVFYNSLKVTNTIDKIIQPLFWTSFERLLKTMLQFLGAFLLVVHDSNF